MTTTRDAKPIKFSLGKKKLHAVDVSSALKYLAKHYGCPMGELICETAEPVYGGRMIWVYAGEFDADTAASMFVPATTYLVWLKWRGSCPLR